MKDWDKHLECETHADHKRLSVLRQVRSLFQSEFCTEGDVVLPLVISGIPSFRRSLILICPRLAVAPILSAIFPFSNVH